MTKLPLSRERGDDSIESLFGEVADDFVERMDRGEEVDVEEYAQRYPHIASEIRDMLPALAAMRQANDNGDQFEDRQPAPVPQLLGDFRLIREIGRGGMGIVYEAEQLSIGRRVALKVLPFAAMLDPRQLQRFKNEVHAAGQLHHTNIVPVFFVGCERGVHFYAMQFIEGQTLADVIADLRKADGRPATADSQRFVSRVRASKDNDGSRHGFSGSSSNLDSLEGISDPSMAFRKLTLADDAGATSSEQPPADYRSPSTIAGALSTERTPRSAEYFRTIAQLGIQAAQAIDHAHETGILHRDIKPSNLLLDVRGNLWIADFGLARIQADATLTMTGDVIGTLRYMSPEQAAAKRAVVDHRADIYSLGVTLYELITLEPAYKSHDRAELLRQIICDDPVPPKRLDKSVPPELETIVLKAMEKDPSSRYATAQELAEDLRRFLQHRPIQAKGPTIWQRTIRWSRRHQQVLFATIVALFVLAVGLGGMAFLTWQAKEEKRIAYQQEVKQRERANASLRLALQALRDMDRSFSGEWLQNEPEKLQWQKQFLERMLTFYESFIKESGSDTSVMLDMACTYDHVCIIYVRLGDNKKGREAKDKALQIFHQILKEEPGNIKARRELARSYNNMGFRMGALRPGSKTEDALLLFQKAVELTGGLSKQFPDNRDYRLAFMTGSMNLSHLLRMIDRSQEGEMVSRTAVANARILLEQEPTMQRKRSLAGNLSELAVALDDVGRLQEAVDAATESLELATEAVNDLSHPDVQNQLAEVLNNLASWHYRLGQVPQAFEVMRRHNAIVRQMVVQYPDAVAFQFQLARGLYNNGWLLQSVGKGEGQLEYVEAVKILEQLMLGEPHDWQQDHLLAASLNNLAILRRSLPRPNGARELLQRAARVQRDVIAHESTIEVLRDRRRFKLYLRYHLMNLASVLLEEQDHAAAATVANELAALPANPPQVLSDAADYLEAASHLAAMDMQLAEDAREGIAAGYRSQASQLRDQAVKLQFKLPAQTNPAERLESLRQRTFLCTAIRND